MGELREYGHGLLDLLFPRQCPVCGRAGESFCGVCRGAIEPPPHLPTPGSLAEAVSVGQHTGALREAVIRLKFSGRLSLAAPLGALLAESLAPLLPAWQPDLLVPVPIHPIRRFLRGFNQSELLAAEVSKGAAIPVEPRALYRTRYERPQVGLNAAARQARIRGAIGVRRPERLSGRRIVLVDDVCTTGATLAECARAAREAGAAAVYAVTLTREAP